MARLRYGLIFAASWLFLLWERLWSRLWPAVTALLFAGALSLLNIPFLFGPGWHLALLAVAAAAVAIAFIRGGMRFAWPGTADVQRHIEKASALKHRPLATLNDTPADGLSDDARGLWRRHLAKTALSLPLLKVYTPRADIAARDRWALRYVAALFFVIGLVVAQGEAGSRLHDMLRPDMTGLAETPIVTLDLWITPPDYTHAATTYLATARQGLLAHDGSVAVPEGSLLKLRLSGLRFAPTLKLAGVKYPLTEAAPRNYTLEMPLHDSGALELRSFFTRLGRWSLQVAADAPPAINIEQIEPTRRGTLKVTYAAQDEYGLAKLTGTIATESERIVFDIPAPANGVAVHSEDVAASPAAGTEGTLTLEAEDGAGHKTTSLSVPFIMPERDFKNPLAQRVIAERKVLLHDTNPLTRRTVVGHLAGVAENPSLYRGDIPLFMALSSAVHRLIYDKTDAAAGSVAGLLWDVAMKLEDGGLSVAQRELSDSLQKLQQALNDKNLSKQELQALMDEVQKKMKEYVQSLARELQQRLAAGQKTPTLSPELAQKFMKNFDVNKLLEQMRRLSQANSREDLQKMAENLRKALDNLDMSQLSQMQEKQAKAMEALQNLEDIIHRQQDLFDKTNKTDDPSDMQDQKKEQSGIRQKLGESLHRLSDSGAEIPENFAKADQGMKLSAEALGRAARGEALTQQKIALDELQKGLDSTVEAMAEAMQQSLLSFGLPNNSNFGEGFDPLGRPDSLTDDGTVKLPAEKERRRVQQIIEELRHRSNEPNRTKVERDYIDRLLNQF